jgi:hypothetical protein
MRVIVVALTMTLSVFFPAWADNEFKQGANDAGQGFGGIRL